MCSGRFIAVELTESKKIRHAEDNIYLSTSFSALPHSKLDTSLTFTHLNSECSLISITTLSDLTEIRNGMIIHLAHSSTTSNALPLFLIVPSKVVSSLTSLRTASSADSPSFMNPEGVCHLFGDVLLRALRLSNRIHSSRLLSSSSTLTTAITTT